MTAALERARGLLDDAHRDAPQSPAGYVDVLAGDDGSPAPARTPRAQRLMLSRGLPVIYERIWRPAGGMIGTGLLGPSMSDERRIARLLLGLGRGDTVLDIACGPGNFTRSLGRAVGAEGLAIGVDASPTMLARGVADTDTTTFPSVAYVRGDATSLPFGDASVDAVNCFAALYLMAEPIAAVREMTRVVRPGGHVAIMTTCRMSSGPGRLLDAAVGRVSTITMFERDAITRPLRELGMVDVHQRVTGLVQFVGARRPE